jgi:hypothetical protein
MNIAYPEPSADEPHPPLVDIDIKPGAAPLKARGLVVEPAQVLDEAELYKYKYLRERAQNLQLIAEKHAVLANKAMQDCSLVGAELGKHLDALAEKYQVNLHVYTITEDGQIVPISSLQAPR